jgi:DNA-binding PadR family transcriptional regulator
MSDLDEATRFLPLTESTFYIMLALVEPMHGYGVMQKVSQMSRGVVEVGPGTLYGAFGTLQKAGLITKVHEGNRRKSYALTPLGHAVLRRQLDRLDLMIQAGTRGLASHK